MTGLRRPTIIAIAALFAAGCGANPPTPASAATTVPTSLAATPTTRPTTVPTGAGETDPPANVCPLLTKDSWRPGADYSLRIPLGYENLDLDVTRIASIANPAEFVQFEPGEPYLEEPGQLVGRWQVSLIPEMPITLVAARARLRLPGREPIPMVGTIGMDDELGKSVAVFDVPDVEGDVTIDFTAELADTCFTYRAEGTAAFQMLRAADAARCPSHHDGVASHWTAVQKPPVTVGPIAMPLVRSTTIGTWTRYATFVDPVVGFAYWDPELGTLTARPGATARIVTGDPDLALGSLHAEYSRRRAVLDLLDGGAYPNRDDVLFRATADPYPDGHFELLVPTKPGRYVASVRVTYATPCLTGDAAGAIAIDVETSP